MANPSRRNVKRRSTPRRPVSIPLRASELHPSIEGLEARQLLTVSINEFGGSAMLSEPTGITTGPDGNLWFTEANPTGGAVGRVTPSGAIEDFTFGLSSGSTPTGITTGSDQDLWFTDPGTDQIGQVDTSGNITEFAIPTANSSPDQIAPGPDGALWFTEAAADKIGRIDTSGNITEFAIPTLNSGPAGITTGPNGQLWFTELNSGKIGEISTTGAFTEFSVGITANSAPTGITLGPDGNLWFTEFNTSRIGRITPQGKATEFSSGITSNSGPDQISEGSDGALWFTENQADKIGRISTTGSVSEFTDPGITPTAGLAGITGGPDGNLWFTEVNGDTVDRISTSGLVSRFPSPANKLSPNAIPEQIAVGSDDKLWFAEDGRDQIGRIDTSGNITEFSAGISSGAHPLGVTLGPPGVNGDPASIWFTEPGLDQIGEISPQGVVTEFGGLTSGSRPQEITLGPDGNLWFTEFGTSGSPGTPGAIGRITPSGVVTEFNLGLTSGATPFGIATGPDNLIYFTAMTPTGGEIGRLDPFATTPVISNFVIPQNSGMGGTSRPMGITRGFNNDLWFGDQGHHAVGDISTVDGSIQEFSDGLSSSDVPDAITAGPDGNYWFTDPSDIPDPIGMITPAGVITIFQTPTGMAAPQGITSGPDGNIWFTETDAGQIGQAVLATSITNAAGTPAIVPAATTTSFPIATFSDNSIATNATNFIASIDYGDGHTGMGSILPLPTPGEYEVIGTNNYATVGTFTATITIMTASGSLSPVTAQVQTTNPLTVSGSDIDGIDQLRSNTLVATFVDQDSSSASFDFTASVDWGDGTSDQTAQIVMMTTGTTTFFAVYEGHTYANSGTFPITVTITDGRNNLTGTDGPSSPFVATIVDPAPIKVFNEFGPDSLTPGAGATGITKGPDGNLWFTETNLDRIGQIDASGNVTEFIPPSPAGSVTQGPMPLPTGITTGPDNNLWFTDAGTSEIGQLTTGGLFTFFSTGITPASDPTGITSGPDNNLWFTETGANRIGRITTSGVVTEFSAGLTSGFAPDSIAPGSDGNLWFVGTGSNLIGRITTSGIITEFSGATGSDLTSITAGPDGDLWFTEKGSDQVGKIDPTTFLVTEYAGGLNAPSVITAGPDNNLYFTETFDPSTGTGAEVGQITTQGVITTFTTGLTSLSQPAGIVAGSDGNLYFTEAAGDRIGQVILPQTSAMASAPSPIPNPVFGHSFSGVFADFTDNSALANPTNFEATIDFGDGMSGMGAVVPVMNNGVVVPGSFEVDGSHVYSGPGTFTVSVTIFNDTGSTTVQYSVTVQAPFTLLPSAATGQTLEATASRPFNGSTVTIDSNFQGSDQTDFTGTINWGDGTPTTNAVFVGYGQFISVGGTKFYAAPGTYNVTATVTDIASGYTSSLTVPINVIAQPVEAAINETVGFSNANIPGPIIPVITPASVPFAIAKGPDGNLYFTEAANGSIGQIGTSGAAVEFPTGDPNHAQPAGITTGPDNNLWYTVPDDDEVDKITTQGVVTRFTAGITPGAEPFMIVSGSDGNLWFTEIGASNIGRITPAGVVTEFPIGSGGSGGSITAGPDQALWFTDPEDDSIGRIDTSGNFAEFQVPTPNSGLSTITAGPNGNLWFTEASADKIGEITPAGFITEFSLPGTQLAPEGITSGPDGNLWFVLNQASEVGRITTGGVITLFNVGVTPGSSPISIVSGPDGNLYFTEGSNTVSRIGQVVLPQTSVNGPASPASPPTPSIDHEFTGTFATFTDQSLLADQANFQATIDFGDGTTPEAGTVELNSPDAGTSGGFKVVGSHTYSSLGIFTVTVTVFNETGSKSVQYNVVVVEPFTLAPSAADGTTLQATAGRAFNGSILDVNSAFQGALPSDYVGTINWGDGSSPVNSVFVGAGQLISAAGTKFYANPGTYNITETVTDIASGYTLSLTVPIVVIAQPTQTAINETAGTTTLGAIPGITPAGQPLVITFGPDGNLWFTEIGNNTIGRITSAGVVTEFPTGDPAGALTAVITPGPDGNLWFTAPDEDEIDRITPQGVVTHFTEGITSGSQLFGIATGSDGNLWFTGGEGTPSIGRITPIGVVTEFPIGNGADSGGNYITAGPDGALWFTDSDDNAIGRITTQGVVTEFPVSMGNSGLRSITTGPDGNLWFTESVTNMIGRITPSGVITEFPIPAAGQEPFGITTGPDGNLWFTLYEGSQIGRITTSGSVSLFQNGVTPGSAPFSIVTGLDGNLYFTESRSTASLIGQVVLPQTSVAGLAVATPLPSPAQGNPFTANLATFRDNSPLANLTNFHATINWGDGSSSPATITESADGLFTIAGGHTYLKSGVYRGTIDLGNEADSATPLPFTITVQATSLQVTGLNFTTQARREFQGPVAVLADSFAGRPTTDYQVTINWGDGTITGGTLEAQPSGVYLVIGDHTYATPGTYQVTTTVALITNLGNANSGTTTATVTQFISTLAATGVVVNATQGIAFIGVVANFTDSSVDDSTIANQVVATIDWGDGTPITPGVIQVTSNGTFQVIGNHTYQSSGQFTISVFIAQVNGLDSANASSDAIVAGGAARPSFVVINTNDSGPGSLRQSILDANQSPGHTITFAIPSHGVSTILLLSPLPDISARTTIDGFSEATFEGRPFNSPLIEVDGQGIGGPSPGLLFDGSSDGSLLEGLSIFGFGGPQVVLNSTGDVLWGNYIGLRADGTIPDHVAARGLASDGVLIFSSGETIGGLALNQRNVISGTTGQGIELSGSGAYFVSIVGNILGLDPTGKLARPNAFDGIAIDREAGHSVIGPGNIISGNTLDGIIILGSIADEVIGNAIGTDITGNRALGNGIDGIDIDLGSSFITVGGTVLGNTNIISGNGSVGIAVQLGSSGNDILFNLLGTNIEGNAALGNGIAGVLISDSPNNIVGPGNVISGNGVVSQGAGIWIDGTGSSGNLVFGNDIGTNLVGEAAIGNTVIGVLINDASNNTIGGTFLGAANVISGNTEIGLMIAGTDATHNEVEGNLIGTDARGVRGIANGDSTAGAGVYINNAPGNTIGGATLGMANIISGNAFDGLQVFGPDASGNLIQGNKVGTDVFGMGAVGNGDDGLVVNGAPGTLIVGNYVSANARNGITVSEPASTNTQIVSNVIGEGVDGERLGNGAFGLLIINAAPEPVNLGNINVNNTLGPIRDTNLAVPAPNPLQPTKTKAKKVQVKARSFGARELATLQDRGQARLKPKK